eukprot:gene11961-5362_t
MKKNLFILLVVFLFLFIAIGSQTVFQVHDPPCNDNLAIQWSKQWLNVLGTTFGFLTPPMNARAIFIFTASMYDSIVPFTSDLKPYICKIPKRPLEEHTSMNIATALSYSVFRSMENIFIQFPENLVPARNFFISLGYDPNFFGTEITSAAGIGNLCSNMIISSRSTDGSNQFGNEPGTQNSQVYSDFTNYAPVNNPQEEPGLTNCPVVRDLNHWIPLLVPNTQGDTVVQQAESPQAGYMRPFAIDQGLLRTIPQPPQRGTNSQVEFNLDIWELLTISRTLNDREKVITEFWGNGIGNSLPAGHWTYITIYSIKKYCLDVKQSVRVLFLQGSSVFDAGIIAWMSKRFFDYIRPISAIQCSFVQNATIISWQGPYLGVGTLLGSNWKPYQDIYFISPAFQEYVSGHSTFSTAAAEVLKLFFNSDSYGDSVVIPQGESLFEPRIDAGEPGFIPGVTNVPNTGPQSIGYTPATDITLFWPTFTSAANESGISRRYGGIHFKHGDLEGRALGRRVGKIVYEKFQSLSL